ncbi:ribosome maturation factor RimP [Nocardioides silvaticus]|uniref:Ribosome maturation factor RimP n=1 Tax=Nocardioides silvaticus TaxID=2201891 RepID=A0A316TG52_9ACTN|nr:ribosome maturation factor RimP [Nocardioides silvaticus]PWN03487.1 ribosome maturation factor RimP [Nocardioides silvaticus]
MSTSNRPGADATVSAVSTAVTGPLEELGLDLEAVELTPAGRRRVLRIAVDKDGGVSLDDVAAATRAVNDVIDSSDVMGEQPYTLEVTSRGVDRPLTEPRHWRRNQDRLVKVTFADGSAVTGRVLESDDERVRLDVDGRPREVTYAEVGKALVQIEFNRKDRD